MANIVREDNENLTALITVNLTKDDYEPAVKKELNKLRQKAQIKGFRKGKVPVSYIKKMYGNEVLAEKVNDLLGKELYAYLEDNKIDILGQPMPLPNDTQININTLNDYAFQFELGLSPEIKLKGLDKSTEVKKYNVKINKKAVDQEIKTWRKKLGEQTNPEDDIQGEDVLTVNVVELENGKPKEGGLEREIKMAVDLLKNKKLAKELTKKKKGDTFELNIFELEDNKPAFIKKQVLGVAPETEVNDNFSATIKDVERRALGDLSKFNFINTFGQEVFNEYFEGDEDFEEKDKISAEEEKAVTKALSKKLKEDIDKYYESVSKQRMYRKVQEAFTKENKVDLPDEFLKKWISSTNPETSPEDIEKDYNNFAEGLKWSLVKNALAKELDVKVEFSEVVDSIQDGIRSYFGGNVGAEQLKQLTDSVLKDKNATERRYQEMISTKLFPLIEEKITIKEETINSDEFDELQKE